MKIVHITLCGPFTDGWNYQENLLAKYHKRMGLDVCVVSSTYAYNSDGTLIEKPEGSYFDEEGINIYRIGFSRGTIDSKLKRYKDFMPILVKEKPDIIFVHGCQFIDIKQVVKYVKHNSCVVYADNHCDFSNCGKTFLSRVFLHRILWSHCFKSIKPYVRWYYGVLPARVDFLINIYRVPTNMARLLIMGGDDELISSINEHDREELRKQLNIKKDDFVIITGGKIDSFKTQVLGLIKAIRDSKIKNIKLIIFGSVDDNLKQEFNLLIDNSKIVYLGWIEAKKIPLYYSIADLAIFPGRHSVLWEQAVAQGLPLVVKYWEGTTHVDCGGNVLFLKDDSVLEISNVIDYVTVPENYIKMKKKADECKSDFLYSYIAKKSIEME